MGTILVLLKNAFAASKLMRGFVKGIGGGVAALAVGIALQWIIEQKDEATRAREGVAHAAMILDVNTRIGDLRVDNTEYKAEVRQMRGWLWELVRAQRGGGPATPPKPALPKSEREGI